MTKLELDQLLHGLDVKLTEEKVISEQKEQQQNRERKYLFDEISRRTPRIQNLISLANALKERQITFPAKEDMKRYGYFGDALAEGICHHVGFMGLYDGEAAFRKNPIQYIGIYNGGACGPWNFYTTGAESFELHEKRFHSDSPLVTSRPATIGNMKRFLKEFDAFEEAFVQWAQERIKLASPERKSEYEAIMGVALENEIEADDGFEL